MPFVNPYYSCDIISEIHKNHFYKTHGNKIYTYGLNYNGCLGIGSNKKKFIFQKKFYLKKKLKILKCIKRKHIL